MTPPLPRRALAWAISLLLLAAACTESSAPPTTTTTLQTTPPPATTTTAGPPPAWEDPLDPNGLFVMLMWHQHQPLYPKDADGVVTRPWVRVHAAKDYYDMAAMLREFPDIQATFNLTPVLLLQLEELANGTKDVYWTHTEIPAADLTEQQRAFIRDRFFDVNGRIIAAFPRFQELADKRAAGTAFTAADYRDLQVLFNLAWTDPRFRTEEPLASLVAKERDFAEEDKATVLDVHLQIIRDVVDIHRELWDTGQIEVTTTPFAHPILPLLADGSAASVGDPQAILPQSRFMEIPDATEHVRRGLDVAESVLGRRPVGMWPGEGAVSQLVMSLYSREGVQWVATGEHVLRPSLDLGQGPFERDATDTVVDAELLYRPWNADLQRNPDIPMFFRDIVISDQLGFQYSGMEAGAAADDLIRRLRSIKDRLDEAGATGPHVVPIILDGENAWEHYPNDGIDHLEAIYTALGEAEFVTTVTPSRYLAEFGDHVEPLAEVFPGAWFSSNFANWIGETEEAVAWDYLAAARRDLDRAMNDGTIAAPALEAAFEKLLFAEGSDWFWWYGSDEESGDDGYFDAAFRELIGQMYDALGSDRPAYVSIPVIPQRPVSGERSPEDVVAITVDNTISDDEWAAGGRYALGADLLEAVEYGFDTSNLYIRVEFGREVLGDDAAGFDLYLGVPSATATRSTTLPGSLLGFPASHVVQWRGTNPVVVAAAGSLPPLDREDRFVTPDATYPAGFDGMSIEFAIPLEQLGVVETGDTLLFKLAEMSAGAEGAVLPAAGPAAAVAPDVSDVSPVIEVIDPTGDDYGPGTYTYPTDAVFVNGAYDITGFDVGVSGDELVLAFTMLAPITNPWGSPNGLAIQTLDVYIDQDPGAGTGRRLLIDGRNTALGPDDGWEYAITAEGWEPAVFVADGDGSVEETTPTFKIITLADRGRVILRIPLATLGGGDPTTWGYAAVVMSQEGFPSSGVRRVRDVLPSAEQWRIGGGPVDGNHTRILDIAHPEAGVQEAALSDYPPITGQSVDTLTPDDFAQIPLLVP